MHFKQLYIRFVCSNISIQWPLKHCCKQQRWAESEKLISESDPDPKSKSPNPVRLQILDSGSESDSVFVSAMLLHTFYTVHSIYLVHHTFHKNSNPDPVSDPKNVAGLRIRSAPAPCPSLVSSGVARRASGGTRPRAQTLEAHQHTFFSHLKTRFKHKFRSKYA